MNDEIQNYVGKLLIKITNDNDNLQLHFDDGDILQFYAGGDCCSSSWIESVESPSQPEKFISFEEIEISPSPEDIQDSKKRDPNDMDFVQYYFYKVTTEKSSYLIEMRNKSNGHYGGWLQLY
jgi:hypothetical protein